MLLSSMPKLPATSRTKQSPERGLMFPNTDSGIHLGLTFDYGISDTSTLVGKVDYIWGAAAPIAGIHCDHYIPFDIDRQQDLAAWEAQQPSWVTYSAPGQSATYPGQSWAVLDNSNEAVRAYQVSRVKAALS